MSTAAQEAPPVAASRPAGAAASDNDNTAADLASSSPTDVISDRESEKAVTTEPKESGGGGIDTAAAGSQGASLTAMASRDKPFSTFSNRQKWFIVILAASAGVFSPISTNIYVPAIPTLADAFGTSEQRINLTVTVYLVFQALTPAMFGSAADCYGRRPLYIICLTVYLLSCIGTALCPTSDYWLLMLMRVVQSSGGSPLIAISTGVIADIALPQERGKYIGVFQLCNTVAPAIGPFLGGVFTYGLGWRAIFWFLLIVCAVSLTLVSLFLPETLRALVGNGSVPPPVLNCTPKALMSRRRLLREAQEGGLPVVPPMAKPQYKPWSSLVLLFEPDLVMMFLLATLYYALWYAVLTVYSTMLDDTYHVSEIIIGVCYIPNGIGCGAVSFLTGRFMDCVYRKEKARVGGDHRAKPEEFRLERVRFVFLIPSMALLVVSCIAMGWSMEAHANIAVPIVLNLFVGLGTGFLTTTTIYSIDLFPGQGGAVTATFNLLRCLGGAVTVSVIQLLYKAIGAGWTFVLLSGICLAGTPLGLIVYRYGPRWRIRRAHRMKAREERRAARALAV